VIKVIKVTKEYDSGRALDDVSLDVNEGDFMSVTGPAGSGKSTLLALLAGIQSPSSGRLVFEKRGQRQGISFQDPVILPYFSIFHNIVFPSRALMTDSYWSDWVVEKLKEFDIKHDPYRKAHYLSGGEARVVSVVRAFFGAPPLVLLDEPTGHLDKAKHAPLLKLIQAHRKGRNTTVLVTHENSIAGLANSMLTMEHGKIINYTERRNFVERRGFWERRKFGERKKSR